MMPDYRIEKYPKTRFATIDIGVVAKKKHHVAALIEVDVTDSKNKIAALKEDGVEISFTSWLIKVCGTTVKEFEQVAAFRKGKQKLILFDDINFSLIVEKERNGQHVPIPLIIEKVNAKSVETIYAEIEQARNRDLDQQAITLHQKSSRLQRTYYLLPGFIRRMFWNQLLKRPKVAFKKMGNVAFTSVGMMGNANGWFIPTSVHPICFGISKITQKPTVHNEQIEIRAILKMTVLLDHNVIDGAPMARFIGKLSENIENGVNL